MKKLLAILLMINVLPAYAGVKCNPLVDYHDGKHLMEWRKMCVGYPYNEDTQHDIGVDGFNAYRVVTGASGGYKRVNACCKGFRSSKIYKTLHHQLNADLKAAAKNPPVPTKIDSAGGTAGTPGPTMRDSDTTGAH